MSFAVGDCSVPDPFVEVSLDDVEVTEVTFPDSDVTTMNFLSLGLRRACSCSIRDCWSL